MPPSVSVVVVAFGDPQGVVGVVSAVLAQSAPPTEVIVVDNHPDGGSAAALELRADVTARVLRPETNIGYCRACELAAKHARGDWLLFLNPDATPEPDCLERLFEAERPEVGILGAQVVFPDGATVNAGHNPVHLTGLSWSGGYGRPREHGPPRDVACVSGAALAIRASLFEQLGGHCPAFVMYHDDVDLCWRVRLAGASVRYVPDAIVRHGYEFDKGESKWLMLEHNRAWTVLSAYGAPMLLLLAPMLAATEVAIAVKARREGWWPQKRRAWRTVLGELGELRRWRGRVQSRRRISDAAVIRLHTGTVDSPFLRGPLLDLVNPWMERYRRAVLWLLRA